MKHIYCEGFLLPVPDAWMLGTNGRSYSGELGLLDPRIGPGNPGIDGDRLEAASQVMKDKQGSVELVSAGKRSYLICSYQTDRCLVNTYSIPLDGLDKELSAVYAFSPGGEVLAGEIRSAIHSRMLELQACEEKDGRA